jgi:hypothetical protein
MWRVYWLALVLSVFLSPGYSANPQGNKKLESTKVTKTALPCSESGSWRSVMDKESIYWTNFESGKVLKAPLAGGTPQVLASGQQGPCGIAVDQKYVYWTDNQSGTVMKVPIQGGSAAVVASEQEHPAAIGVDKDAVYWVTGVDDLHKENLGARFVIKADENQKSGGTIHCDLCPTYCTRTVCDTKGCHTENYLCGMHSCNCRPGS